MDKFILMILSALLEANPAVSKGLKATAVALYFDFVAAKDQPEADKIKAAAIAYIGMADADFA
jgi:hypothetical protein